MKKKTKNDFDAGISKLGSGLFQAIEERGPMIDVPSAVTGKYPTADWDLIISQLDKPDDGIVPRIWAGEDFAEENKDNPEIMQAIADGRIVILTPEDFDDE